MLKMIEFVESSKFAGQLARYLSDEEFNSLQQALINNPEIGDVIKGSGGIRKMRWGGKGIGKRGGYRIIYYYRSKSGQIYLLTIYAKSEMEDLTAKQLKTITEEIEK
jgi:mRNA-degrading endonuclease RelE of RelBE toxin-antitoxin system